MHYYYQDQTLQCDEHIHPNQWYSIMFLSILELGEVLLSKNINLKIQVDHEQTSFINSNEDYYRIVIHKKSKTTLYLFENQILIHTNHPSVEHNFISKLKKISTSFDPNTLLLLFELVLNNEHQELNALEQHILSIEQNVLKHHFQGINESFLKTRKSLLHESNQLDQITSIFEELNENELFFFDDHTVLSFENFANRYERYSASVHILSEYLSEVITIYQSEVSIQQNEVMKFFTVIAAIFMPPTLLVGWYGMNFKFMPELLEPYAYPLVFVVSILLMGSIILYLKKKKYF